MKVSTLLRRAREQKGLTQGELAKKMGYASAQFVSNWERGTARPPDESWVQVCKILDIPREEIFKIYCAEFEMRLRKILRLPKSEFRARK